MKTISLSRASETIPRWAVLERSLLRTLGEAVDIIPEKYLNPDYTSKWPQLPPEAFKVGSADDVYESFHSWPLAYVLGGDKKFLTMAKRAFEAVTQQLSRYPSPRGDFPCIEDDFFSMFDWMHIGESMEFFYNLNLADPADEKNRERAVRFAGYYLNEGEHIAEPNYDFEHHIIRSTATGTRGACFTDPESASFGYQNPCWLDFYNIPFFDVEGVKTHDDLSDPENARRMGVAIAKRQERCDAPANLLSTSLMTNAYLHTGDEKFKTWVLDYVNAWRERTAQNNGVIPDNVGPNGIVGELMEGKWYGGYYGWCFPHGFSFIAEGITIAGQNQCLLTGDTSKMAWVREQTEKLLAYGVEKDGAVYVPYKYADPGSDIQYRQLKWEVFCQPNSGYRPDFVKHPQVDGRFEFQALDPRHLAQAWHITFDDRELEILKKTSIPGKDTLSMLNPGVITKTEGFPDAYSSYTSATKYLGGQDRALTGYHAGLYPDYPEDKLQYDLDLVFYQLKKLREDTQPVEKYGDDYLQLRNPVVTEGLVHLTMGCPLPQYNGGILMASLFYFDPAENRPGLPEDVAALVSQVSRDSVTVTLVNTSPLKERTVILQGGAYGEHSFTGAEVILADGSTFTEDLSGSRFAAELCPGSVTTLKLSVNRFANDPRYHTAKA